MRTVRPGGWGLGRSPQGAWKFTASLGQPESRPSSVTPHREEIYDSAKPGLFEADGRLAYERRSLRIVLNL